MTSLPAEPGVARLKWSWGEVAAYGDQVPLFFYSTLFLEHPEVREMFPVSMAAQRDRLVTALGRAVSNVDNVDSLVPFLQQLGRDHRKFAVVADHYPAVGSALLQTLEHFLGADWTPDLAEDWTAAYGVVAKVMSDAADDSSRQTPSWWDAEVVSHERRAIDLAVIRVAPDQPLEYLPGQSIAVESAYRPRMWRQYSPANAPRPDGTIDFHVRLADAGQVSPVLVDYTRPGDRLRLAAPMGTGLVLPDGPPRHALMLAGGTGVAPLKALAEQIASIQDGRRVYLYWGARYSGAFYDLPALAEFAARHEWFHLIPVVSDGEPANPSIYKGHPVGVALRQARWLDCDVFVCGPPGMVSQSVAALTHAGIPDAQIHREDNPGEEALT